jgi:hypothetical protein
LVFGGDICHQNAGDAMFGHLICPINYTMVRVRVRTPDHLSHEPVEKKQCRLVLRFWLWGEVRVAPKTQNMRHLQTDVTQVTAVSHVLCSVQSSVIVSTLLNGRNLRLRPSRAVFSIASMFEVAA